MSAPARKYAAWISSIAFGWVRIRRSLLPLMSRWKFARRSPRIAASSYCRPWIMVPMAPSSTRMRSRAAASSWVRLGETGTVILSGGFLRALGADAEQMADGEHEVGAVHGVEVEGVDAMLRQLLDLAGGDGGGHQLAGLGIVVETFELVREPVRHRGAGTGDKIAGLLEIVHRHDAGHDRNRDAAGANPVEIAKVEVVVEEHLRNRARSTRIDLGLDHVDVGVDVRAFRMFFGIGRNRNLDIAMLLLDAGNELRRTAIAIRVRRIGGADSTGRIAAQRHDVADPGLVLTGPEPVHLAHRGPHPGQGRGRS